ncbi:MAG TPA: SpoIIE family protein phosphatase, partial [Candidatus Aquilonibacter sp.]|nr:SpoIIE family protein phosphatase [Candidatus Aquilonibacter sp.]
MEIAGLHSPRELIVLVDALPVPAVVALDAHVGSAHLNGAMQRLLGIPSDERLVSFESAPYHIESYGRFLLKEEAPLARATRGETVEGETFDFVLTNGRRFELMGSAQPIRDDAGRIVGAIATFTDVTDVRSSERVSAERLAFLATFGGKLSDALTVDAVFGELEAALVPRFTTQLQMELSDEEGRVVDVRGAEIGRPWSDEHYFRIPMTSHGRRVGTLTLGARGLRNEDVQLLFEVARRAATAIQNAQLYEHHESASKVFQEALLPAKLPTVDDVRFDAVYAAGDDRALIGGDWYDAFELPDGRIAVSIGDVTGRGVIAAALMGKVRQTISGLSFYETDPVKLLDVAELALMRRYPDSLVTAIVGVFDPSSGEFIYATAGHPHPFLRRADGTVLQLPCHGLPLGLRQHDEERSSVTFRIMPGDTLVLYTDGLTEANHDPVEGERRAREALASMPAGTYAPARYMQRTLLPDGSRDDVALIALTFDPPHAPRRNDILEVKFDSRDVRMARDLRTFTVDFLKAYGAPDA